MIAIILGVLLGCLIISHLSQLPSGLQLIIIIFSGIGISAIVYRFAKFLSLIFLGIVIGVGWSSIHGYLYLQQQLPQILENKTITLQGTVITLPTIKKSSTSFLFKIKKIIEYPQFTQHYQVRLSWYENAYNNSNPLKIPAIKPGDHWQFQVRLKSLHGFANPGSFDLPAWGIQHGVSATGYVLPKAQYTLLSSHWYAHPIGRLRWLLRKKLFEKLGQTAQTNLIAALIIGDQSGISVSQWQVFQHTGTNHLMAIAGLHIGFWTALVFFIINFLWRCSSWLCLRIPSIEAAGLGSLIVAVIYSALAGFSLPTQRALVMISVFIITLLSRRKLLPFRALAIALGIVLIINPFSILSASFWLSFGAVFSLIYGLSYRLQVNNLWWKWGRLQWVITLALIPFSLLFFQQASLCGFLANIIAVPWVGLTVLPLSLIGSLLLLIIPSLGILLLKLASILLKLLWPILTFLANFKYGTWQQAIPSDLLLLMALIGILILIAPKGLPRWLGIFWLAPLIFFKPVRPEAGQFWLTVLDVGQGLATVIQTQHHTLIYDTGPKYGDDFNAGDAVIIPFLQNKSVTHIDMLIVSHGDNDHIGGADAILQKYPTPQVFTSEPELLKQFHASHCQLGQHWNWDGVNFEILYPLEKLPFLAKRNNISCVLRISTGDKSVLLPGDIEKKAENYLVRNEQSQLSATILVAPHHGSNTSSTPAFLRAVKPQYAVFATGFYNHFGFPKPIIVSRYHANGVTTYNTADRGAILFKVAANKPIDIECYRCEHQRFWDLSRKHTDVF